MIKKLWRSLVRWWRLHVQNYYDPYFKTEDGVHYATLPNGQIVRLDSKKDAKRRKKAQDLRAFFNGGKSK